MSRTVPPDSPAERRPLFLYGTLRLGGSNHAEMAGATFGGPAWTEPGWTLIRLDGYPGLVPAPGRWGVTGEIWWVTAEHLTRLDIFEGVHEGLYRRDYIRLIGRPAKVPAMVETYLYAHPWQGEPEIGRTWRD